MRARFHFNLFRLKLIYCLLLNLCPYMRLQFYTALHCVHKRPPLFGWPLSFILLYILYMVGCRCSFMRVCVRVYLVHFACAQIIVTSAYSIQYTRARWHLETFNQFRKPLLRGWPPRVFLVFILPFFRTMSDFSTRPVQRRCGIHSCERVVVVLGGRVEWMIKLLWTMAAASVRCGDHPPEQQTVYKRAEMDWHVLCHRFVCIY